MKPDQIICGDNIDVLLEIDDETIDLTVTSPWYHNAINYQQHVSDPGQNYRGTLDMTVDEYVEIMGRTFAEVFRVTRDGGYCCIVIGNETAHGTLEPLPALLVARLRNDSWRLHEEIIWHKVTGGTNRAGNFVKRQYPSYYRANIMHESILVMRKGKNRLRKKGRNVQELQQFVVRHVRPQGQGHVMFQMFEAVLLSPPHEQRGPLRWL